MPIFNIDVEKQYLGDFFSNRYQVNTTDILSARALADDFVQAERSVSLVTVLFTKVRTSDTNPDTDAYFTDPINQFGAIAGIDDCLPSFCRVRVDFGTENGGRPCRKYLLPPVPEVSQVNGTLTGTYSTTIRDSYVAAILSIGEYCDPDGSAIVSGSVFPRVAMRQLRRASKRKNPVI